MLGEILFVWPEFSLGMEKQGAPMAGCQILTIGTPVRITALGYDDSKLLVDGPEEFVKCPMSVRGKGEPISRIITSAG